MAKLFTNHDPLHLHATLGFLALGHFAFRWFMVFSTGTMLIENESLVATIVSVSIHFWLPFISLLLPVPKKRNFSRPMIWPEFRLHSLLFATRHVTACLLSRIYNVQWQGTIPLGYAILCLSLWNQCIMIGASLVTRFMGSSTKRTTNAMPYPPTMPDSQIQRTRNMYRDSQFLAASMAHTLDPTLCFLPLLAIQMAPFLMTLVRKNLTHAGWHHAVYAWALWLNLPGMICVMVWKDDGWRNVMSSYLAYWFVTKLRIQRGWNKHIAWLVGPLGAHAVMWLCHRVSGPLAEWMPSLHCPRVYWLIAKSTKAAVIVAYENKHVLLPTKYRQTPTKVMELGMHWIEWLLGSVCDGVFAVGVSISFVVLAFQALGG